MPNYMTRMVLPQKIFSLLLVTLLACAMERSPPTETITVGPPPPPPPHPLGDAADRARARRESECEKGAACSDDACRWSHPITKMFCKRTPCKFEKLGCKYWKDGRACRYLHQCKYEKGGRMLCRDPECKYNHINNILFNQARIVANQGQKRSCQSHALAGWLTHWIETSPDPAYQALAQRFRCKADAQPEDTGGGNRLYDFIFQRLTRDFEHVRAHSFTGMKPWYNEALQMIIPGARAEHIQGPERAKKVAEILKSNMPLIFEMFTTKERMTAFQKISTFGDHIADPEMQKFLNLKDSIKKNRDSIKINPGIKKEERKGHAMLCCPDPTRGGFAIKNSWGKDRWGKNGIVYLRPDRCDEDSDFVFTKIVVPDHAPLNDEFFDSVEGLTFYVRS